MIRIGLPDQSKWTQTVLDLQFQLWDQSNTARNSVNWLSYWNLQTAANLSAPSV